MDEEIRVCNICGEEIENDDYYCVGEDIVCSSCFDEECGCCDRCGTAIYNNEAITDADHFLCEHCYENHYVRCEDCGRIVHNEDSYYSDGCDFCFDCNEKRVKYIHEYSYKPVPILYGEGKRHFGIELEIDNAGRDEDNAEELLNIANRHAEHFYIKTDGSLDDGMELVTHPMTLDYHLNDFNWDGLCNCAVHMGYRSHQTSTCGLHIHVSRDGLGDTEIEQEDSISKILYFVEVHWNELLKFSRRTEYAMNRWAARHGYEHDPKKLLDKAKHNYNRYVAVNLCNRHTIEFRLFRGTLKVNTLYATLQLVNRICDVAMNLSEYDLKSLSWSEFVSHITEPELIQYLKERRLYVNEEINNEEEV